MTTLTQEAVAATLGSLDDWQSFVSLYSIQITVGAVLSALTIYRKQLSSNRCFHEDGDDEHKVAEEDEPSCLSYEFEMQAEELLDGAGLYCSGAPIVSLLTNWLECFPGDDVEGKKLWLQQEELTTSDLLEKAGNYCSVELIEEILLLFHKKKLAKTTATAKEEDRFTHTFPPDIHVHIASFLHPKDVTTLSCVSKSYNEVVSNSETSKQIWRSLWMRDFSWLVTNWDVGIQALSRSNLESTNWETTMDKTFYFMFRQTYINWIIAGENTMNRCLVGLHGNIYDISSFLNAHPGSPDTLMVHSGQDATRFFEDINHSNGARRLAKSLCVVLDLSSTSEEAWGVRPTSFAKLAFNASNNDVVDPGNPLLLGRKERKGLGTLSCIKERIKEERKQVERRNARKYASDSTVLGGQVNTYYDAFRREWRVWYTDSELQNVFAPA
ncbi:unnamed protein product [Cylindrotheca closterium]|uniref:Cytochrome b5 heme-binding domain-containing protein n=1 Tax=Cylindrotheca closterium TaxID=2856 RepID=A0AAD2GDU8_9STRA|nr:unnamed protein product [Cylindrotheca closterium]